ncbi:glycosyltransferase family 2 protein [Flavobacterium cellulosilyticum]|uniref:Glycosyltransferase n=1 Tax=Flavobacterium cellulosilyticum TaxID=2541731 RepID=A0A4R5CN87_9FLAO|nr:glycosyltransferase [Flavobacterium cellulosilyticum]TDD99843.1 glycosyltransferase [Flavobacterium cellulosilyticum]
MQRIPTSPPNISPIEDDLHRPLWSVMIPAYNCSQYLSETIQSVLQQDMGIDLMQIEVIDDCSTDSHVEELVRKVGKGRVSYFSQKQNVGSLRNFETCINRSRGKYIHLLHGDDRVKTGYYTTITNLFEKYPTAGAAYCAWNYITSEGDFSHVSRIEAEEEGILENWLYKLAEHPRLQYVTICVKREVYEKLGSFYLVTYGEDWEMWARIAKQYPTAYTPKVLAEYREHKNSITWQSYRNGQNIKDLAKVTSVIVSYLPKKDQRKMIRRSRQIYIYWVLNVVSENWQAEKNKEIVYIQIKTIFSIYVDYYVINKSARILLKIWSWPILKYFTKTP